MKAMMTLITLFNLLLIFLSPVLPGQVWADEDWMERGLSGLKTQHFEAAIEAFSRAIKMNPDRVEAYNNRGIAWCKKGEYDRAIADYNKALEIDPRCADVYNNRGGIWFYKGEYDLAIHDFDKALGVNPNFAKAYSNRGAAWFCKGNFELAIDDYNKALEINPNSAETNKQLAWILSVYSGNVKKGGSKAAVLPQTEENPDPKAVAPRATLAAPIAADGSLAIEEEAIALPTNEHPGKEPEEHLTKPKPHEITESGRTSIPKGKTKTSTIEPPRHKQTGTPSVAPKTEFSIQVGAFQSRENAETLTARLKEKGYAARLVPLVSWSKKILYTVRMGEYATRREAEKKAETFSDKENLPSTVRPAHEL